MLRRLLPRFDGAILRLLRGTEWSQLADYVSPSFFEVMPARRLAGQAKELVSNAADGRRGAAILDDVARRLGRSGIAVRVLAEADPATTPAGGDAARRELGQRALEIYFAQLFAAPHAVLDLRASRFAWSTAGVAWFPRPFWVAWDPAFLDSVRRLYRGFYGGDDRGFDAALAELALTPARDAFLAHFGGDDQRRVRFRSATFHESFHEVFVRCRDAGVSLHGNFLPLGVFLAALYDHLESLGVELDVRDAFERATAR